ncbi:MAG: hypothetical protein AB8F95_04825 [Bacteroidia bacterium]
MKQASVWVFSGEKGAFPSAVFSSLEKAESWIKTNNLSGVLTEYPIDLSAYDWAIQNGYFKPQKKHQKSPQFIQRFSDARQRHFHYEDGLTP